MRMKIKMAALSGLVGATQSVSVTVAQQVTFATPPYLQNVSTNRMVVMCESVENLQLGVEYGTNLSYGAVEPMTRLASGGGTQFQRALLTGLQAGTTFHYRLVYYPTSDPVTTDAVFQTAPAGAADIKFGVWGDSQGDNHGTWRADPLQPTTAMMQHMAASGVDFGFGVGDMAENGLSYSDTRNYFLDRVVRHLGTARPFFIAWGNHDIMSRGAPVRLATDLPSRFRPGFYPGIGSYAFTYANVFFVALDYYFQTDITDGWLAAQLASPEAQNARFRIVGIHVPPYSERWINGDSGLRTSLVPLLEQYAVTLCFSGHTHEYERGATNGVNYVITGGGSWLDLAEPIVQDWPHMTVGGAQNVPGFWAMQSSFGILGPPQPIVGGLVNHYTLVTVRGNYLKLEMRGFNADGSYIGVLDVFEIGTDPGLICRVVEVAATPAGLRLRWSSVTGFRYRIESSSDLKSWSELEDGGQPVEVPADGAETEYVVSWPSPLPPGQFLRVKVVKP